MKPQETKFEFVYNEIKQCILDGQIPHGNALPSSRSIANNSMLADIRLTVFSEALRAGRTGCIHASALRPIVYFQQKIPVIHQALFLRF